MFADALAYTTSCQQCQVAKARTHCSPGVPHPLPVPENPWDTVGMDFLGPFPEANTPRKENYLMVVSDHLGKETIFIPCRSSPHDGEPLDA
eukprot:1342058-Rhodomonas_salina.1